MSELLIFRFVLVWAGYLHGLVVAYSAMKQRTVKALLEADFTVTDRRYLGFDSETGYHHYVIDAAKYYEWEV